MLILLSALTSVAFSQNLPSRLEDAAQVSQAAASAGTLSGASGLASQAMDGRIAARPTLAVDGGAGAAPARTAPAAQPPKTVEGKPVPPPEKKDGDKEPGALSTWKDAFLGLFITPVMLGMSFGSAGGVLGGTKAGAVGMGAGILLGAVVGLVVGAVMGVVGFVKGLFSGFGKLFRGKV